LRLLGALVLAKGGGGFEYYADTAKTETHLIDGGPPALAEWLAAELGDGVHLGAPVRRISQSDDDVTVVADGVSVRARRVIVATPPALASHIDYQPALPAAHAHLLRRMVPGSMIRVHTIYDEPFWRAEGLSGEIVAPGTPVVVALDQSPPSGTPGVLNSYAFGSSAIELAALPAAERRRVWLGALADAFGPAAATPRDYLETDWSDEEWSLGAMIAHFAPGVLTSYGPALRQPVGRIHWAGAERATLMHGLMEGAVRSGEATAAEVLAAESPAEKA